MTPTIVRLAKPYDDSAAYRAYVLAQATKTQKMGEAVCGPRVTNLIGALVRADRRSPIGRSVLCVGCRNSHELQVFHAAGFGPVTGIDLVSQAPGVIAMDMHLLQFPDASFDVIFSCHSLEHAWDVEQVLREWRRVSKPEAVWVIEVPIAFTPTTVDRIDVQSLNGLRALVDRAGFNTELWASATETVARLIVQVS